MLRRLDFQLIVKYFNGFFFKMRMSKMMRIMVAFKYRYQYLASLFLFLIGEYSSKKCLLISIDNRNLNPRITEVIKNSFILLW